MSGVSTSSASVSMRTYGNFHRPRTPGVGGLGSATTIILFAGVMLVLLTTMLGGIPAGLAGVGVLAVVMVPLLVRTRDGRTGWAALSTRIGFTAARWRKRTVYAPQPDPVDPAGALLPGLLSRSRLQESVDTQGMPFAVLCTDSAVRHFTTVIELTPEGGQLVDAPTIDAWVAHWGKWLADLGDDSFVVGAAVTVQTHPDPGTAVAAEVDRLLAADAPGLAAAVMRQAAAAAPLAAPAQRAWASVTWTDRADGRRLDRDELLDQIAHRLPGLRAGLAAAGGSAPVSLDAAALTDLVAAAYTPGRTHAGRWDAAGPLAADEQWDRYSHGGATSVCWQMVSPARDHITAQALGPLLAGHGDVPIKRMTLLYRPHPAHEVARVADFDRRTAAGKIATDREQKAVNERSLAATRQADSEVASGAGLVRFALLVTGTTTDDAALRKLESAVRMRAAAAHVRLAPAVGAQAASFAAGLGVGVLPTFYTLVPSTIREAL